MVGSTLQEIAHVLRGHIENCEDCFDDDRKILSDHTEDKVFRIRLSRGFINFSELHHQNTYSAVILPQRN